MVLETGSKGRERNSKIHFKIDGRFQLNFSEHKTTIRIKAFLFSQKNIARKPQTVVGKLQVVKMQWNDINSVQNELLSLLTLYPRLKKEK